MTALVFLALLFTTITVLTAGMPQTIALAALSVLFIAWMTWNSNRQTHRLRTMRGALRSDRTPGNVRGAGPVHTGRSKTS
ncbi:hypothetical protein E5083_30065 [Streptomyces bauhiniae]|uniref:Uncharacterized protein n=1 Tax=Streptomyces bauhiniae TaxID=2340725 RepID=A0A4Z1CTY8_9ACTN|nr:hypothetical protein [Streptomyces bauhiniae]TGN72338.1 hypothetical protein E5083_30065 [Streptomyces bauhiniae]